MVTVNGTQIGTVNYPVTVNWDRYLWSGFSCYLNAGTNSIKFSKDVGFADWTVYKSVRLSMISPLLIKTAASILR